MLSLEWGSTTQIDHTQAVHDTSIINIAVSRIRSGFSLKYGCRSASLAVNRFLGSYVMSPLSKSTPLSESHGKVSRMLLYLNVG
jgi:hypothetical protein